MTGLKVYNKYLIEIRINSKWIMFIKSNNNNNKKLKINR